MSKDIDESGRANLAVPPNPPTPDIEEILASVWNDGVSAGEYYLDTDLTNAIPEAQASLLRLAMSCLPEKKKVEYDDIITDQMEEISFNHAIDTIEQNILTKFGGKHG